MQFFDKTNAWIICLYCFIIQSIIVYSEWTGYDPEPGLEIAYYIYAIDGFSLMFLWLLATIFIYKFKGEKIKTFGLLLILVGSIFAFDRIVCFFGDLAYGAEMDAKFVVSYIVVIVLELLLLRLGVRIYRGDKLNKGIRISIVAFMIMFILSRAAQLMNEIYSTSDFIDIEFGIFICIFLLLSVIDDDIRVSLGAKLKEDEDLDF